MRFCHKGHPSGPNSKSADGHCRECLKQRMKMRTKEQRKIESASHYKRHREEILSAQRARYAVNPQKSLARTHRLNSRNPKNRAVTQLRSGAKKRKLIWDLSQALAVDLVTDNCFYCGAEPILTNGIDRVDNARGYVDDNVVTACKMCNVAKRHYNRDKFEAWVKSAASHMAKYANNGVETNG